MKKPNRPNKMKKPNCPNYDPWQDQGDQVEECIYHCYWDSTCRLNPRDVKPCPWTKLWKQEIDEFSSLDLSRTYKIQDMRMPLPTEDQIQQVLHEMGKTKSEDQLGCGACGYPTCREFAVAHVQGLTNYEMCYSHSIKKLHTFIDKLNSANEKLRTTQDALKESEEKSRSEELSAREAAETVTTMLNKIRAGVVLVDENLKIVESNRSFVNMLGEDAKQIDEMIPGLKGADLKTLLPFTKLFESVLHSGEDILTYLCHPLD